MRLEGSTLEWEVPKESIGANVETVVLILDDDGAGRI